MKRALFLGGTGTISSAITALVANDPGWELYLLNRGNRPEAIPDGVKLIRGDVRDEAALAKSLEGMHFDCVCDFIAFVPADVERDWRLFKGRTGQYIFISSASAYEKPCRNYIIKESTPLSNPFWQYARDKAACEAFLFGKHKEEGFPVTVVRPTFTYSERKVPMGVRGNKGTWPVLKRMLEGKPVLVHGDGTSLWTMTDSRDFARGFVPLMANSKAIGEAFHITSDETLTWDEIYRSVARALGVEAKLYHVSSDFLAATGSRFGLDGSLLGDKGHSVVFDLGKLRSVAPGYKPQIKFADGIKRTVDYVLTHPDCQQEEPEFDEWCDRVIAAVEAAKKACL